MTFPAVLAIWAVLSVPVALLVGRVLRRASVDYLEVCVEPGCTSPATHKRLPAGDVAGFSSVVELACRRHGEVERS